MAPEDVEKLVPDLPTDFPDWIALWIMDKSVKLDSLSKYSMLIPYRCDNDDIWTGAAKDPSIPRVTYGTAQKMCAAISHKFGRDYELGTRPWAENPVKKGEFVGNPSLSIVVSQYMISLRRRKVNFYWNLDFAYLI